MLRLLVSLLAILGAGGHHAARLSVSEPRPFEVWDGRLEGRAPAKRGTKSAASKRRSA